MPRPKRARKRPPGAEAAAWDRELISAVKACDPQLVEELLEIGADPNVRDEAGEPILYSAVHFACAGFAFGDKDARIVSALIDAGGDPKLDDVGLRLARLAWSSVCSAAEAGDARRLAALLAVPESAFMR